MMRLKGKRILMLVDDEYEELELWYPRMRLTEEGAEVVIAGLKNGVYHGRRGYPIEVGVEVKTCKAKDFHGLILTGGFASDRLRQKMRFLNLVKEFDGEKKPIGVICHGQSLLVSADIVKGEKMTRSISLMDDAMNAGAHYVKRPIVVDGHLVTAQSGEDLPDFCRSLIESIGGPDVGMLRADYFKRSFRAVDGLWFMMLERELDFDKALKVDVEVWKVMPKIQVRKVKELLRLRDGSTEDLLKALSFKFEAEDFGYRLLKKTERMLSIEIQVCPWYKLLEKSKRQHLGAHIGKSICPLEYESWGKEVLKDFQFEMKSGICAGLDGCQLNYKTL